MIMVHHQFHCTDGGVNSELDQLVNIMVKSVLMLNS